MEKIFLDSATGQICCSYSAVRGARSIAILCHGYLSDKNSRTNQELSRRLNAAGLSTLAPDLYGHGESEGNVENLTISKAVDGILAAYDYAASQKYGKIALAGSSFSGGLCLIAAVRRYVSAISLKCPVFDYKELSISRLGPQGIRRWKEQGYTTAFGKRWSYEMYEDSLKYDMCDIAADVGAPTLIIHGSNDATVPLKQARDLLSCLACEKHLEIIDGGDHRFSNAADFKKVIQLSSDWLARQLKKDQSDVLCCPRCKRPVQAKYFMKPFLVAALRSVLSSISCPCGYHGLPISLSYSDYMKWKNS